MSKCVRSKKVWLLTLVVGLAVILWKSINPGRTSVAPPHVVESSPLGVRRGVATELTIRGSALLGEPRLVAPFNFTVATPSASDSTANSFKTRITPALDTPLGIYPIRILTTEGLSDPFPLAVGQLSQVEDREVGLEHNQNAERIAVPLVIEGQLPEEGYVSFKFQGKKGQKIVADLQGARLGSGADANLALTSSSDPKFLVHQVPSIGSLSDTPLFVTLPKDDDYFFGVDRAADRPIERGRPIYRLTLGALPAAAEVYPLGGRRGETVKIELRGGTLDGVTVVPVTLTPASGESIVRLKVSTAIRGPDGVPFDVDALPPLVVGELPEVLEVAEPEAAPQRVIPPVVLNGRIDPKGDVDRFTLSVTPGERLRIDVASRSLGAALRPKIEVLDGHGHELASSSEGSDRDHVGLPRFRTVDPILEFLVPEKQTEVALAVSGEWLDVHPYYGFPGNGHAYRVTVAPKTPGFAIELNDAQVSVPSGGVGAVGVTVVRDGFNGPITLRVVDPPPGLTYRPGVVAAGHSLGAFTIAASKDATLEPFVLDVIGEGRGPSGPIATHASKLITFGAQTTQPYKAFVDVDEHGKREYIHYSAYLRSRIQAQPGLFVATSSATPITLSTPDELIDLEQGASTKLIVTASRPKGVEGPLTFSPLPLPPGFLISRARLGATESETAIEVKVNRDFPTGLVTVVLVARGTIAGVERSFAVPALTFRIVPPRPSSMR